MSCRVYRNHLIGWLQGQHSRQRQPSPTANEQLVFGSRSRVSRQGLDFCYRQVC